MMSMLKRLRLKAKTSPSKGQAAQEQRSQPTTPTTIASAIELPQSSPVPPRISSSLYSFKTPSIRSHRSAASQHSNRIPPSALPSPLPKVSIPPLPSPSTTAPSTPSVPSPPPTPVVAESTTKPKEEEKEEQPIDIHIDMVKMDVDRFLPTILSEELILPEEVTAPQQPMPSEEQQPQQQPQPSQPCVTVSEEDSTPPTPTSTFLPTPLSANFTITPPPPSSSARRPPLVTRKSTDSYLTGRVRVSMSHLQPPPPPSIPPPAIPASPSAASETVRSSASSMYAAPPPNVRGRKPRSSTESYSSSAAAPRRSISLDSPNHQDEYPDQGSPRGKGSSSSQVRGPKRIIMPPTTPPPPSGVKLQPLPVHARRKHQKTPSQLMSPGYFSAERSPMSPLSPLSPLTVQIPRNVPASPASARNSSNFMYQYANFMNRPDSPTTGQQQQSGASSPSAKVKAQARRLQSKSASQADPHRIIAYSMPSSPMTPYGGPLSPPLVGPRSPMHPSALSRLSDHLPPPPLAHAQLMQNMRRPSLAYHQQSMSGHSWDGASKPTLMTPSLHSRASSAMSLNIKTDEVQGRRSVSVDDMSSSWMMSRRSSPTSPTGNGSILLGGDDDTTDTESIMASRTSFERDMELQAIISDALARATAKTAAMDSALYTATHRQQEMERFQRHSMQYQPSQSGSGASSRCWTPSDELVSGPSSRSESPFYPPVASTPSPTR